VRWILDDGPLGHLVSIEPALLDSWTSGVLLVSETSARAMLGRSTPRIHELSSRLLEPRPGSLAPLVGRFSVDSEDAAWPCFLELRGDSLASSSDLAEHECIAWAQVHGGVDTAFVCADKKAVLIALAELGCGRVGDPFDVWFDLLHRGYLTSQEFRRLCEKTLNHRKDGFRRVPGRINRHLQRLGLAQLTISRVR
jgi:hypothetical protein